HAAIARAGRRGHRALSRRCRGRACARPRSGGRPSGITGCSRIRDNKTMPQKTMQVESVAQAYLGLLAERGVEYLFANAGTDFAPIIEAFAAAQAAGRPVPKPMIAL